MARMSGFEKVANIRDDACIFASVTAPSRFHRTKGSGEPSPKYDGSSSRDAQHWLRKIWSRVRTALARHNIPIYGFRVAEPHHDGTPHWHLLLFAPQTRMQEARKIIRSYWLSEDGDEPGAARHRVVFKDVDPEKGSATGYIAKYVSKAIDVAHIECDQNGLEGKSAAERVVAHWQMG